MPDFAAATHSAAASVPLPKKNSSKAKKLKKGSVPSAIEAAAVSVATASSTTNASHAAATTVMQPICQSPRAAAKTAMAVLRYILYEFKHTNLYVLCFCMNS